MSRLTRFSFLVAALLLVMACWPFNTPTPAPVNPALIVPPVSLAVTAQPPTYNTLNQVINYNFLVTNTGTTSLPGPVTVSDNKMVVVSCPDVTTTGNKNANLDPGEAVTCTGGYAITQADISSGSMTNTSKVTIGGQSSNPVDTTIQAQLNKVLTIAVTSNPTTYNLAGQAITNTYVVTNTGPTTIGPAQFIVKDARIPDLINCGPNTTTLATNQTISCTGTFATTAEDTTVPQISSTASATTATGVGTIQPATITIYNSTVPITPNSALVPGSTVQHKVQDGEWMLQIARCYGANYEALIRANPLVKNPNVIFPVQVVTVPNIGSNGTIYGPKDCVLFYTAVSGDTWQTIATKFNADLDVLRAANTGVNLAPGVKVKVPNNSKGGPPVAPVPQPTPYPTVIVPTAIIPTAIPTIVVTPIPQPTRLNFPAGNPSSLSQTGTITTLGTIRYVFAAVAGQTLNIQLVVPTNDVNLALYGPNNVTLKAPDAANTWNGTLPTTGDYFIDLISSVGIPSKTFTLNLTLTTPASTSNTERVADIYPGSTSSNPSWLSPFNAQLYFQATGNNNAGQELWRYDRASNATAMADDIFVGPTGSIPTSLRLYQNMLYFGANGNDGTGTELWRFNGSDSGRVNDLYLGDGSSNPMYMTEFNGELYFSANGNDGRGIELWKFNGSTSATTLAADINQGPGNSNPSYLTVYNNLLYFAATTTNGGTELWKFDGTNATLASDIWTGASNSNPAFLVVFNNLLYFSANGNNGSGTELWKFDGTTASMAADINPGPADSAPTYMTPFKNALFFGALGNDAGFELWKFDGTTASMAADINPGNPGSSPAYLAVYSDELYFQATGNDNTGAELWKYKGP